MSKNAVSFRWKCRQINVFKIRSGNPHKSIAGLVKLQVDKKYKKINDKGDLYHGIYVGYSKHH